MSIAAADDDMFSDIEGGGGDDKGCPLAEKQATKSSVYLCGNTFIGDNEPYGDRHELIKKAACVGTSCHFAEPKDFRE